jgi:hypothetical protein
LITVAAGEEGGGGGAPAVAADGSGGAWAAWVNAAGKAVLSHLDADGVSQHEVVLDDGRESTGGTFPTSVSRGDLRLQRLASGRLAMAYLTTVNPSATMDISQLLHLFLFDGATQTAFEETTLSTSPLVSGASIDLDVDNSTIWVAANLFGSFSNSNLLRVFDPSGNRLADLEDAYADSSPGSLRRPAIAVRADNVVIVGANGNELQASVYDPADKVWEHGETVETFDDTAAVPDSRDVVVRAVSGQAAATLAAVAYGDGSRLYLAYRLANTNWSARETGRLSGAPNFDSDTAFVRMANPGAPGDFHLAWTVLKGSNPGTLLYESFDDPDNSPVDTNTFLTPENAGFEFVERFGLAIDRFGFRYLAGIDQGAGGALRLSLPRASRDDDGDGVPLFMELALGRDPATPESAAMLRAEFETTPDDQSETVTLAYDRPTGSATVSQESIVDAGLFRYTLKGSTSLGNFGRMSSVDGVRTFGSLPSAESDLRGATEQRFGTTNNLSVLPRHFYRLRIDMRPED